MVLKRSEREIRNGGSDRDPYFYFASLSSRTIVYKGMLTPQQVTRFYLDLMDLDMQTAIAMVHSRFSTNTFPSWERAHPNRYLVHNGEINTIRGNVNWTHAREKIFETDIFGEDITKIYPVINEDGSDSAMLDNYIQMLELAGFSLPKAIMMSVPEPYENDKNMDKAKRAFYQYNSTTGEAWDGPAAIGFTDGTLIGAVLDRNGLRPARYYVTSDNKLILSSEVGVLDIPEENIIEKSRLEPGKMLLVDTKNGRVIPDEEIKAGIASEFPYEAWVKENMLDINTIKSGKKSDFEEKTEELPLLTKQKVFGYTYEDVDLTLKGIAETGEDPITAMGTDTPLACLSDKPQLLYNYFKQLFAQVTNPPIDAIGEESVTGTNIYLGGERNMLEPKGRNCRRIKSDTPILTDEQLEALKTIDEKDFKAVTLPILYDPSQKEGLTRALDELFAAADTAIGNKYNILILSDRGVNEKKCAIPALLAGAGLHHHLIRKGTRLRVSIVLETGEPREVHHFAVLLGYGVNAVDPYLVYETLEDMSKNGFITKSADEAKATYINAVTHGIVKIMSKMGISTVQSYMGAQIFEALGVSKRVVERYFTGTATRIGGITIKHIAKEAEMRHQTAFDPLTEN
ncbi:MAG: glutamate synthase subunit alpha, partial [Firmicutes bacterium]|nr:glutamate synthase subunit alpha [Bacillota bacterium]